MASRNMVLAVAALFAASASLAQAQSDLLSFSFSDLHSSFDGTSLLTIGDDDNTDGELTRLDTSEDAFFAGDHNSFDITMTVSNISATMADGVGTLTFTDIDGDVFSGDLTGDWIKVDESANFVGQIMNFMPDSTNGDGIFNGSSSGSFDMDLGVAPPFSGNIITLVFESWFTDGAGTPGAFDAPTTQAIGAIVPEPATLALLALGALVAGRRRA